MSTIYPVDESYRSKSSSYAKLINMTEEEFVMFFVRSETNTYFTMFLFPTGRGWGNATPSKDVLYIPSKDFYAHEYKNKCNKIFPDTTYCGKVKSDVILWETPPATVDTVAEANKIALSWLSGQLNKFGPKGRWYTPKFYYSQKGVEIAKRILTEMLKNKAVYNPVLLKQIENHINKYNAHVASSATANASGPVNPSPVATNVTLDPVNPSPVATNVNIGPVNLSPVANMYPVSNTTSVGGRRKTKRGKRKARRTKKRT